MSWDDEDFDVPTATPRAGASWEEEAEDDPVVDSWDVDEDELARQKKEADEKKKAELKKKQDEAKAKKAAAKAGQTGPFRDRYCG
ncbi:hypothetical protein HF325_004715 [Metschnikowia pulcherrima]|uniref:Eukaryotic translation initiation factor 3 30 kDa subunit n=1 Tax=Metschnikowia pulcherrima TaxID=27326 RepID=A0A8H7L8R6_9ASCO|nr:hypothetical protein HF325_004715 [Metschnikowia pulcherrima]